MSDNESLKLSEAAALYLATLPREESELIRQEINKFVRWYSQDKLVSRLTESEVAGYAEHVSSSNTDYVKKLDAVKAFLSYTKKKGWTQSSLAANLKAKKTRARVQTRGNQAAANVVSTSQEGYDAMKAELEELKRKQMAVIEDIRRAAADKDLKENAPYHAAREQKSYIDGKIMELEEIIKSAVIVVVRQNSTLKVSAGDTVILNDMSTGEAIQCTLVGPREVDPSRGRISSSSPIGRAVLGRVQGDVVEITVPAGKVRYEIKKVSH